MTLFGFALVIAAAFCHAAWNYFVKKIDGGPELVWLFSVISVFLYLPFALYIFLSAPAFLTPETAGFMIGSALLHLAYFLLLQQGYRRGDLSLVYPTARATGPFLATVFAVLLGEDITLQVIAGGAAVILGVLGLTGTRTPAAKGNSATNPAASVAFGLGAGILIASYTVWDAYTVAVLLVPPLMLDYTSSLCRAMVLAPVALKRRQQVKDQLRRFPGSVLAIAFFNPLAYILVLYALTFTPVVLVAPLRETSVLITVLMGSLLLGEGHLKHRLKWAVVILGGISLLATA